MVADDMESQNNDYTNDKDPTLNTMKTLTTNFCMFFFRGVGLVKYKNIIKALAKLIIIHMFLRVILKKSTRGFKKIFEINPS